MLGPTQYDLISIGIPLKDSTSKQGPTYRFQVDQNLVGTPLDTDSSQTARYTEEHHPLPLMQGVRGVPLSPRPSPLLQTECDSGPDWLCHAPCGWPRAHLGQEKSPEPGVISHVPSPWNLRPYFLDGVKDHLLESHENQDCLPEKPHTCKMFT